MRPRGFAILLAVVIVLGGVIGGAFAGGIAIGKSQGREEASQMFQNAPSQLASRLGQGRPQQRTPQAGSALPAEGFTGMEGRGVTRGTVEKVEGEVITIRTGDGSVSVVVADSTSIQKMTEGGLDDISPGQNITVSGQRRDDGSIEATSISLVPI